MSKKIRLSRDELVWETRCNEFGPAEWENTKAWAKQLREPRLYNIIQNISWDEAFAAWKRYHNSTQTANEIMVYESEHFKQTLGDWVNELVREDNYDSDISDTNYADEYEEHWEIYTDTEEEEKEVLND